MIYFSRSCSISSLGVPRSGEQERPLHLTRQTLKLTCPMLTTYPRTQALSPPVLPPPVSLPVSAFEAEGAGAGSTRAEAGCIARLGTGLPGDGHSDSEAGASAQQEAGDAGGAGAPTWAGVAVRDGRARGVRASGPGRRGRGRTASPPATSGEGPIAWYMRMCAGGRKLGAPGAVSTV